MISIVFAVVSLSPLCRYGLRSRSVRGNVTQLFILEENMSSCRKRFRCTHSTSGSSSTLEYFTPLRNLLHFSQLQQTFSSVQQNAFDTPIGQLQVHSEQCLLLHFSFLLNLNRYKITMLSPVGYANFITVCCKNICRIAFFHFNYTKNYKFCIRLYRPTYNSVS